MLAAINTIGKCFPHGSLPVEADILQKEGERERERGSARILEEQSIPKDYCASRGVPAGVGFALADIIESGGGGVSVVESIFVGGGS